MVQREEEGGVPVHPSQFDCCQKWSQNLETPTQEAQNSIAVVSPSPYLVFLSHSFKSVFHKGLTFLMVIYSSSSVFKLYSQLCDLISVMLAHSLLPHLIARRVILKQQHHDMSVRTFPTNSQSTVKTESTRVRQSTSVLCTPVLNDPG